MQTILALDTATEACSVALQHQGKIYHLDELSPRSHTQRILPMVDELLQQANIRLSDVNFLAFGRGPGSFTGVRVGVGIAQGLAFGANLPLLPISNLTMMAEQAYQQLGAEEVVALIDARMDEVYFAQLYRTAHGWQHRVAEQVCSPADAISQIQPERKPAVVGTGWGAYPAFNQADLGLLISEITLPSARFMFTLAEFLLHTEGGQRAEEVEPVYLRNQVTWQKLPHKRD